jgi:formate/nitrite transporter FocA (FNT family)
MLDPNKAADKVVSALQGTPMLLVLVLLNLAGLFMIAYLINASAQLRFKERAELVAALRECMQRTNPRINDEITHEAN